MPIVLERVEVTYMGPVFLAHRPAPRDQHNRVHCSLFLFLALGGEIRLAQRTTFLHTLIDATSNFYILDPLLVQRRAAGGYVWNIYCPVLYRRLRQVKSQ